MTAASPHTAPSVEVGRLLFVTPAPGGPLHRALVVHIAARTAERASGGTVEARTDADGLVTLRGDVAACLAAHMTIAEQCPSLVADPELAAAMGCGVQYVAGPVRTLDEVRAVCGLGPYLTPERLAMLTDPGNPIPNDTFDSAVDAACEEV